MVRVFWIGVAVFVAVVAGLAGYQVVASRLAADIYKERLETLSQEYVSLRGHYNEAVERTAVTELFVHEGELEIVVRTSRGVQERIVTDLDPYGEVYLDYVVVSGRLLIRRVFDAHTPPSEAFVVDPMLDVDWEDPRISVGKAVYRELTDGRWVVSVTGDGSLGLARAEGEGLEELPAMPDVREYEMISEATDRVVSQISIGDVWGWVTGADE